ncbi:hypothetical protein K402DRAFT_397246 [Aulographum hederae CBS 113979]|uniref:Uncharacterized protein n=1 Tax=Aulographum hederae CBS 113979 TaxID=1176131 RepID=A0A6G1GPH1_9PEZI|nr:hypothetical protein K402DRAFT_397246 [Aulographum hederae CBS 113979]
MYTTDLDSWGRSRRHLPRPSQTTNLPSLPKFLPPVIELSQRQSQTPPSSHIPTLPTDSNKIYGPRSVVRHPQSVIR